MVPPTRCGRPPRGRPAMMGLLPLLLVSALCRPSAASILVIEQQEGVAEYKLDDSPSHFGPLVSMTGLRGYLVLADPVDGCGVVAPPPAVTGHHHWLLLLGDGNCSSGLKVLHAQQAGYLAAIVFNVTGDEYSPMKSDVVVKIPSFYIGLSNGIMLRTNFLYGSGYSIYITGFFPYTFLAFIIPAMLLIVFCMLVLIAIMLYRCFREYRRTARRLLPKRMLAQIPIRRYTADGGGNVPAGQETCAICLEDYLEGDQLRVLPCRHVFHCQCVDPWLLRSRRVCPVCKRRLVSATVAMLVSDSEDEQLLPVYRSQRLAPARRSYGATLATRGLPPAGGEPRVHTRSGRRSRRTRRRPEGRPTIAAVHPPAPDTVDDVTVTTSDVTTAADDVRLLGDDHDTADGAAAAAPPDGDTEVTVAPCGGARPKLGSSHYTRLQELTDSSAVAADSDVEPTTAEVQSGPVQTAEDELAEVAPPPPAAGAATADNV